MKGFELVVNEKKIVGAVKAGITSVIITCKQGQYNIVFSSLDDTGMVSSTWFSSDLELGDKLTISFENIIETPEPARILDYKNKQHMNQLELEAYYKLRDTLINEGLIKI